MSHAGRDHHDLLPLTPAVFHILLALADGARHGYSIMREVASSGEGRVRMGAGTLYGSLQRMERGGLVEETAWRPDPAHDDSRRRYYRMTSFGREVLEAESARLARVVALARSKRLIRGLQLP